jgi:hypothetical protein
LKSTPNQGRPEEWVAQSADEPVQSLNCARELAGPMGLDQVEQRLVNQPQGTCRRRDGLTAFDQPNGLLLELQRVPRSRHLCRNFRVPCLD